MVTATPYHSWGEKPNCTAETLTTPIFFYTEPVRRGQKDSRGAYTCWLAVFHLLTKWDLVFYLRSYIVATSHNLHVALPLDNTPLFHRQAVFVYPLKTLKETSSGHPACPVRHRLVDQVLLVIEKSHRNLQDRLVTLRNGALCETLNSSEN